jgi:hypothetical protein
MAVTNHMWCACMQLCLADAPHTTCSAKATTLAVRLAALHLAAAVVEGLNPGDRTAPSVQAEAFTLFQRAARVGLSTLGIQMTHSHVAVMQPQ